MKKIVLSSVFVFTFLFLTALFVYNKFSMSESIIELMLNENIEALTEGESGNNYVICYYESRVVKGYTYYDCGTCSQVYDEKGRGTYSKCFR